MTVWNEADVIESTVRNLFAEGCDRVLLLDNDSDDDTVARAEAAGAQCLGSFTTDEFSDTIRTEKLNEAVQGIMAELPRESVWWLFLDADEFPTAPGAATLRGHLAGLNDAVRCVGSFWVNHYPGARPHWLEGFHPADVQRLAGTGRPVTRFSLWNHYCPQGHVKHQLVRHDPGRPFVTMGNGFHTFESPEILLEPEGGIWVHHFQFRGRASTLGKLDRLMARDESGNSRHATKGQWKAFETGKGYISSRIQYNRRGEIAPLMYDPRNHRALLGFDPENWIDHVAGLEGGSRWPTVSRWYDAEDLFAAVRERLPRDDYAAWLAHYLFDNKRFPELLRVLPGMRPRNAEERALLVFMEFCAHLHQGTMREAMRSCRDLARRHPASELAKQAVHMLGHAHQG